MLKTEAVLCDWAVVQKAGSMKLPSMLLPDISALPVWASAVRKVSLLNGESPANSLQALSIMQRLNKKENLRRLCPRCSTSKQTFYCSVNIYIPIDSRFQVCSDSRGLICIGWADFTWHFLLITDLQTGRCWATICCQNSFNLTQGCHTIVPKNTSSLWRDLFNVLVQALPQLL